MKILMTEIMNLVKGPPDEVTKVRNVPRQTADTAEEILPQAVCDPKQNEHVITVNTASPAVEEHHVKASFVEATSEPIPVKFTETPIAEDEGPADSVNIKTLSERIENVVQQIEEQGNILQKVVATIETVQENVQVLTEQQNIIQDLTTRLRQAEEQQTSEAVMKPVLGDLIRMFDTIWGAQRDFAQERPGNVDEWIGNCLGSLEAEMLETLNRYGTVMIQDTTKALNPSKQRVVGTQYPPQIKDGDVLAVIKPGFIRNGRVERPEEVIVAKTKQTGGAG